MNDRLLPWLAVVFALIILGLYSLYIQPWTLDDAFIAFRYADNIAGGNGPVYNAGEKVEGYTSFLWVILLAFGKILGADVVMLSKILGIGFAMAVLILLARADYFIGAINHRISGMAVLLLGSSGAFLPWGVSGMEVTLYTFLVLLTVLYYVKILDSDTIANFFMAGVLCGLESLTRPEGMLITGLILIHLVISKKRIRFAVALGTGFLLVYLPYFIWRFGYYGYLFPNTFYAKVGWHVTQIYRGFRYLVKFVIPSLLMLLPFTDPSLIGGWLREYRSVTVIPVISFFYTVYIVLVGGDPMPASRFFTPILPFIALLSVMFILTFERRKAALVYLTATIIFNLYSLSFLYNTPYIKRDRITEYGREVGLWLKDNVPSETVIATNTAGSIPYYSGLKTIDMLGLNDLHIAHKAIRTMGSGWAGHEKADGKYILARKPDLIQFGSCLGKDKPVFLSDSQLYNDETFRKEYRLREITLPSGNRLLIYERIDGPVLPDNAL